MTMSSDSSVESAAGFATFLAGAWVSDSSSDARTSFSLRFPLHDMFFSKCPCINKADALQTKLNSDILLFKKKTARERPGRDAAAVEKALF